MLRFTSPDLPTVVHSQRSAPFLRLYHPTSQNLAPLFRFNVFGLLLDTESVNSPLKTPDFAGLLYRMSLGFLFQVLACGSFRRIESPTKAAPLTMWGLDQDLYLYDAYQATLTAGEALTLDIQFERTIPEPEGNQYSIDLPDTMTVTTVTATGLIFLPAEDAESPQPGEFTQAGTALTLYGSNEWQIRPADRCTIVAAVEVTTPEPLAWALTFDLSQTELEIVVAAEHLGGQYVTAQNPFAPQVGDLLWEKPFMTLIAPLSIGKPEVLSPSSAATANAGSTIYTSYA